MDWVVFWEPWAPRPPDTAPEALAPAEAWVSSVRDCSSDILRKGRRGKGWGGKRGRGKSRQAQERSNAKSQAGKVVKNQVVWKPTKNAMAWSEAQSQRGMETGWTTKMTLSFVQSPDSSPLG